MGLWRAVSLANSRRSGAASPWRYASSAPAQARSSSGVTAAAGVGGSAAARGGSSRRAASATPRRSAASRVIRRVNAMRWSAVRFDRIARTQRAGSRRLASAPAMRQIRRSGRSIMPTVHVMPTDSARAFV